LLGQSASPALSSYRGRVGLALSGGGFRASFFHVGVLARLADVDALRSVEVLSTVSGGSIVGAHYYLLLRQKLAASPTRELTRKDYVAIVEQLSEDLYKAVARNIRMRTLSNLAANVRMFVSKSYSRSARLGDLYERELYSLVTPDHPVGGSRRMEDLRIAPRGTDPETFKPKFENWQRRAKVPALLLNATSLNSGHNWQFTARWMGEAPGLVDGEVDAITRYRRMWYAQAPTDSLRNYPLGKAVAASSCLPGLFDPLVLEGLYPGRTVRLVDGGVHDNQGVGGLLNEGCTVILCSDASGQMDDVARPGDNPWSVPLRCSTVLQGRVRVAQYQDLKGRLDSRALQAFLFVHLKKDLEAHPLDWIRCQDPTPTPDRFSATTTYGVDRDLQRKLSEIRTDLDSFTEVESSALMASGYRMIEHELGVLQELHQKGGEPGMWGDFDIGAGRGRWSFLNADFLRLVKARSDDPDARRQDLGRQLEVSRSMAFKVWRLMPALTGIAIALGVAAFAALVWFLVTQWSLPVEYEFNSSVGKITLAAALLAVTAMFPLLKWLDPTKAMRGYLNKAGIAVLGCIVSNLHLWLFDWLYRRRGRMKRLLELQ
jgi:predicted acylesterase/phospholipase RssA